MLTDTSELSVESPSSLLVHCYCCLTLLQLLHIDLQDHVEVLAEDISLLSFVLKLD